MISRRPSLAMMAGGPAPSKASKARRPDRGLSVGRSDHGQEKYKPRGIPPLAAGLAYRRAMRASVNGGHGGALRGVRISAESLDPALIPSFGRISRPKGARNGAVYVSPDPRLPGGASRVVGRFLGEDRIPAGVERARRSLMRSAGLRVRLRESRDSDGDQARQQVAIRVASACSRHAPEHERGAVPCPTQPVPESVQ